MSSSTTAEPTASAKQTSRTEPPAPKIIEAKCSSISQNPHPASVEPKKEAASATVESAKSEESSPEVNPSVETRSIREYNDLIKEADEILIDLRTKDPAAAQLLAQKFDAITKAATALTRENEDLQKLDQRAHTAFMDHLRSALSPYIDDPALRQQLESKCSEYKNLHVEMRQFRNDFQEVVEKASYASKNVHQTPQMVPKNKTKASQVNRLLNATPSIHEHTAKRQQPSPTQRMASSKTSSLAPSAKKRKTEKPGMLRRILM